MSDDRKPPTPAPAPKRKRRVPRKVHQAIELIATGRVRTIKAAAERVGWSREGLSRRLNWPECIEAMKTRAAKEVALGSGRAAARLGELLESESAKVAMEATKFSLQAAGIGLPTTAPPVNLNVEMKAGWIIDLSGGRPKADPRIIEGVGVVVNAAGGETPIDGGPKRGVVIDAHGTVRSASDPALKTANKIAGVAAGWKGKPAE